jgi:hypothetical protein
MGERMSIKIGETYVVNTDRFFAAPDGKQYRAAYGTLKGILSDEETLGIKTNRGSTNWYIEIGNMFIAGCQVMYISKSDKPNFEDVEETSWGEGNSNVFTRPTLIYNADES